jgi:hypothetical protein
VGYVNVTTAKDLGPNSNGGLSTTLLVGRPLNVGGNTLGEILPTAPPGTAFFVFNINAGTFESAVTADPGGAWDNPAAPWQLGAGGAFVFDNGFIGDTVTLTFVGEVPQGNLVNPIPVGLSMKSSIVPQEGLVTAVLNYQPTGGDLIYQYDTTSGLFITSQYLDLGPGLQFWDNEPNIKVGESFYIQTGTAKNWTRTFTVN